MLLEAPVERLDVAGCVAAWKSWEETERDIRAVFAGDPELVARGLKETYGKYVDRQGLYEQLTRLRQAWPELRERIRRQIIRWAECTLQTDVCSYKVIGRCSCLFTK